MKAGYFLAGAVCAAAAIGLGVRAAPQPGPEPTKAAAPAALEAPPLDDTNQPLPPNHPPIGDLGGPTEQAMPPNHPPMGNDPGTAAPTDSDKPALLGEVKEAIQVPGYTYLRLQTDKGEVWAAVTTTDLKVGAKAKIVDAMEMKSFNSSTLKRTFDSIYFGRLDGAGSAPTL
ncbi:MAG: hypothetical protein R3B13_00695 [Polyangiaceae bacterium]